MVVNGMMVLMRRLLFLLLFVASCRGGRTAGDPVQPLREFRGIIHCHSYISHDSKGRYEEILAAAKAADVDFVIMTDHPPKGDRGRPFREGWRGLHDGVLFIQGAEYASRNLLALGIKKPAGGKSTEERIAAIQAQGGVAIVSHPEEVEDWEPYAKADGMEIFNVHAAFKKKMKEKGFVARMLRALTKDPDSSFELLHELDPRVLARWAEWMKVRRIAGVAGNDAHQNANVLGLRLDPYERNFKFVSTTVTAEALTEEAILSALRQGRSAVRFGKPKATDPP